MKTVKISLNSIDKVKSFVNDLTKFDTDFDLVSGRYVIDAKSIMGIFSLDLSKPIDLNIHDGGDTKRSLPYLLRISLKHKKKGCNCKGTEQLQGFKNCRNLTSGSFFAPFFRCSGSLLSSPVPSSSVHRSSHPAFSLNS